MLCAGCGEEDALAGALAGKARCPRCGLTWQEIGAVLALPRTLFNQAVRLARVGDLEGAQERLQVALQLDPDLTIAWVVLGKVSGQQHKPLRAIAAWKEALKRDETNAAALRGIEWARPLMRTDSKGDGERQPPTEGGAQEL